MSKILERIFFIVYDIIFFFGLLLYLPLYFWRKKINLAALSEKMGFIGSKAVKDAIWIQVVSVGEVNLIENLLKRLKEVCDYPIVVSTTTLTGNRVALKKYSSIAKVIFFPFDISLVIHKVVKTIKPKIFIAVETEVWPNLFYHLKKKDVPIVIINGRISDKAFERYKSVKSFMGKFINKCDHIGVQNKTYKERFSSLGANPDKIIVSGNMKFESIAINQERLLRIKNTYTSALKREDRLVMIAASTHSPEEEMIINIYKDIFAQGRAVSLVIAPRHPQRVSLVEKVISAAGFEPVRVSKFFSGPLSKRSVFILDTVGELLYFYSIADICFVGGSLIPSGGHNILEPIYFLKPTLFGPYMDNFKDIESIVLEKKAGLKVESQEELKQALLKLVKEEKSRTDLRNRCLEVFEKEKSSLDHNLEIILKCVKQG